MGLKLDVEEKNKIIKYSKIDCKKWIKVLFRLFIGKLDVILFIFWIYVFDYIIK